MDLDLRDFLCNSLNEAKKEKAEKYTYLDSDGKKVTVTKDKNGNVVIKDENGNKKKGFQSDLSIAKSKMDAQERAKKEAKENEDKKKLRNDDESETEKHFVDLGNNIKKTLVDQFGILGSVLSIVGDLTIGTVYNISKDAKKRKQEEKDNQLAILKRADELVDEEIKNLGDMSDEEKADYEKAKALSDKVMAASYDDNGKLLDDEAFANKFKSQFKNEKEFNIFVEDAKNMRKEHPELSEQIDKVIKTTNPEELESIKKDLPSDSKKAQKRNATRNKYESEYNKALEEENKKYETEKSTLEDSKKSNDESISKMQSELDEKNKKLEDFKSNKPKDMSEEAYNAEIQKLEKEIENTQNTMSSVSEKANKKYNDKLEKIEKEHNDRVSKLQKDFEENIKKAGIKSVEDIQKEEPKKEEDEKDSDEKEETVKDSDGSEITSRKKKVGKGMTYVRTKNGKEMGHVSKDEFLAAKKKNESLSRTLKSTITESFRDYIKNKI